MIRKLGNRNLLLILLALLVVFGIFRYISNKKGENTFQTAIIPKLDTNKIDGMMIFPGRMQVGIRGNLYNQPFIFSRKGDKWYISQNDVHSSAELRSVAYVISQLEKISPDRLGSNNPKDWKEYCVNDSLGTRVVLLYGKDTALDVMVGRFSYVASQKQAISYMRLRGQKEVYAVDGFLSLNITEDFDAWRNKKVMPGDYPTWTKLTFTYPADSGFIISKDSNEQWVFADGTKPDSATAANIIKDINNQNYGTFVNNFDVNGKQALFTMKVEGSDFTPVLVKAYPADSINKYAITSSLNPESFFSGNKGGMFSKVFLGKRAFIKKENKKKGKK